MVKIALCDDRKDAIEQYSKLLKACAEKYQIEIEVCCFFSGEELLFHLSVSSYKIDIIYLDIMMEKLDGMETARQLRSYNCNAQIVFLTSCEDYVYEAFDVNAVQYLIKDELTLHKFETVFLKAVELASRKEEELFACEFGGETSMIPISKISYFEIWKRAVTVHYGEGQTAKFYSSMEQLEKRFAGKDFVRVHRSFLVHFPYIAKFQQQSLILKTGQTIPVGGTYEKVLKTSFSDYISRLHVYDAETFNA